MRKDMKATAVLVFHVFYAVKVFRMAGAPAFIWAIECTDLWKVACAAAIVGTDILLGRLPALIGAIPIGIIRIGGAVQVRPAAVLTFGGT
jgi:hypothetical protein